MNFTKRLFAIALVAVMLVSSCVFASAYTYKATPTSDVLSVGSEKATYQTFMIDSGESNRKESAVALEFDPKDGYVPMVFSGYSGSAAVLSKQYEIATKKYGYDVVGVINGAFFSMDFDESGKTGKYGNYGTLVGYVISNGKVATAHNGYNGTVVAFDSNGKMDIVKSNIEYKLYIKGSEVKNGLYYINKTSGNKVAGNWNNSFYYYDTSCGNIADTFEVCPGYEVVCEKVDNTELCVGGTLKGKVLEVKANSYGTKLTEDKNALSNKFVLFVKTSSPNAALVKDLVVGDEINISANETIAESKEIIENANSVIDNVGWLVKDGVDQTQIYSTIGSHSVTLAARWTAFGQKADGSYVYFTSEGGTTGDYSRSITLRDVAKFMIAQGCVNVIRMDGGGSSAMYVKDAGNGKPGYLQPSTRAVGDCILVVKKSSVKNNALEAALKESIKDAKAAVAETPNADISALITKAEALLASNVRVSGDVQRYILKIASALSGKEELEAAVTAAGAISFKDYSEPILAALRDAANRGSALLADSKASIADIKAVTAEINEILGLTGANVAIVTKGKPYTTTAPNRKDLWDDDGIRLTDGTKGVEDGGTAGYAGWSKIDKGVFDVVVDLQDEKEVNYFRAYVTGGNWGITEVARIKAYTSHDGTNFTAVNGESKKVLVNQGKGDAGATWNTYTITINTAKAVSARYIKFELYAAGNGFVWTDEVEAGLYAEAVTDAIKIDGFNTKIGAGNTFIFTSAMENLSDTVANLKFTANLIAKWDEKLGAYVVTKVCTGSSLLPEKLAEDEILIGAHDWETGVTEGAVVGSAENHKLVTKAKAGQVVELYGIDVKNQKTDLGAYVKIVDAPDRTYLKGDTNGDGKINSVDYVLLKRHVLKSYTLTGDNLKAADVNNDNKVNAVDYVLVKRHVLKTYTITQD